MSFLSFINRLFCTEFRPVRRSSVIKNGYRSSKKPEARAADVKNERFTAKAVARANMPGA
jgi:hypothetical protein